MTEITHEDVKAFMNEPDPVPEEKAPEPMGLDDWAPAEEIKDWKLTTEQVAMVAYRSVCAYEFEQAGIDTLTWSSLEPHIQQHYTSKANYFIQTAGNPNGHEECAKMHDLMLEARLRDGWTFGNRFSEEAKIDDRLLPYRALPPHERAKDFLFRSVVISLLQIWKGY